MSGRGPRGGGTPPRGRGNGDSVRRGRGRADAASFQALTHGGRGDGRGGRGDGRGGSHGDRGGSHGGRGGGHGPPHEKQSSTKLGDDEHTADPRIFSPSGEDNATDAEVDARENKNVKENRDLSLSTLSLADFQLPLRPDHGNSGEVIRLRTNHFKMTIDTRKKLYKYRLALTAKYKEPNKAKQPAVPPERSRKRRQALALLFQLSDFQAIGHGVATDYSSTIITSEKLPLGEDGTKDYIVTYREIEDRDSALNPIIYTFNLLWTGLIPTTELLQYLASTPSDANNFTGKDDAIQALNIIVARTPNFDPGIFQSGNNKFFHYPTNPNTYVHLGGGLIAVRGYYTSVRTSTLRTLLNVNVQTSPFYPAMNVLDLTHGLKHTHWSDVESFLHLLRVKTVYSRHDDGTEAVKVKTVLGFSQQLYDEVEKGKVALDDESKPVKRRNFQVDPLNSQQIWFKCEELGNKTVTVEKYFKEKYRITLRDQKAALLNCGTREKPVWIPQELCEVMPGQAFRGKLSDTQTAQMIVVAARGPAENARRIVDGDPKVIGFQGNNPSLAAFGVRIDSKMIMIKGRILPAPRLTYGKKDTAHRTSQSTSQSTSQRISHFIPTKASWNIIGKQFAKPIKDTKWSYLRLGRVHANITHINAFEQALRNHGFEGKRLIRPQGFEAPLPGPEDANDASIEKIFNTLYEIGVKMVLVVLPDKSKTTYARVKYWADVRVGIHSICVLQENLGPNQQQYYANVALKFNLKAGGINQRLPEQLGFLHNGDTMVVGIDVSHPAPKSMEGTPSIAGVVASIDNDYGQWPGSIRCQASKKEMVSALKLMMGERLKLWIEKNHQKPAKILIYRDGVSEGQYKTVLEDELKQIREACIEIYSPNVQPRISIVVVGKRHHTRFYPTRTNDSRGNPQNGTVVDRGVTMEEGFDFFLQAHTAIQGTAKPTHYVVILNELKLGAQELQTITHHL